MTEYDAAYQGAPGAFSEEAALAVIPEATRLLPCRTFVEVFDALDEGRALHAVVPVENSLAGPVEAVADLLAERDVTIVGEITLRIAQTLIGPVGATLETIRRVRSHPVALKQCVRFFERNPHLEALEDFDTAGAVESVVRKGSPVEAAIGPRRAAAVYGGTVLLEEIQDAADNRTRFLVLAR